MRISDWSSDVCSSDLGCDDHMIFHLGMSGRWRTEGGEAGKHDHLLLETGAGHRLFLHDPRRFGSVDLVSGDPLTIFPAFVTLGPERSEARSVGTECVSTCRSRWTQYHINKKCLYIV